MKKKFLNKKEIKKMLQTILNKKEYDLNGNTKENFSIFLNIKYKLSTYYVQ